MWLRGVAFDDFLIFFFVIFGYICRDGRRPWRIRTGLVMMVYMTDGWIDGLHINAFLTEIPSGGT